MNRRLFSAAGLALLLTASLLPTASAQGPVARPFHVTRSGPSPISKLDRSLVDGSGRVAAIVRLVTEPVGSLKGAAPQKARAAKIEAEQAAVQKVLLALDRAATVLGQTKLATNALLVEADAAKLKELARDARVLQITQARDYQLDLSETVPYIGATVVHESGFTGEGVVVAVLDSGIDYTHAAFGGPGTVLAYKNAYGVKTKDTKNRMINESYLGVKLFPTAKVIGGWDFVGEAWTGGAGSPPLRPDPDPIDCSPSFIGCGGGHGTHVADIIAGALGVAPDASIFAVKVCSSITTSCSNIAMLQGLDLALDPNSDDSTADRVDMLNMSIGSQYGQTRDDALGAAVQTLTDAGTLVVASAGNSGDKPYATGTPAASPSALSVAQTAVPSSTGFVVPVSTDGGATFVPREAVFQSWSHELDFAMTNVPVQFGDGAGGNLLGCDPFPAGSVSGEVVLVNRGVCNFSAKIANIAAGGGAIGIIGLVTTDDPFDGSLGLCPDNLCAAIPGFMVSQSTANLMRAAAARVSFDAANQIDLVMHMVGSSSRGPDNDLNHIKPEIGAPGASVSAVVGTGTGTAPFGGTSGAAPMVTGSGALLREAYPGRSPLEIKAVLMNTGFTEIMNRPAVFGGDKAPITRIGGGEVRVNRALTTQAAAWDADAPTAALNFGFHDITAGGSETRTVTVRNYGGTAITYNLSSTFRFANDLTNGAVTVTPSVASVNVAAHSDATFDVTINVDGTKLRAWTLDSGAFGASASRLQTLEYDGYLWLDAASDANDIHLPWMVLPRKSGDVSADETSVASGDTVRLTNSGVGRAWLSSFSLIATSPDDEGTGPGDDLADVDLRYVGVRQFSGAEIGCDSAVALQFGVNTWERQVHANGPALFEFDLDIDQDGAFDYAVFNLDLGQSALSDGRNVTWALNIETGAQTAFWFTVHATNSGNTTLTVCGEQIGIGAEEVGDTIDVLVLAADWYNSGAVTDFAEASFVAGVDRYAPGFPGNADNFGVSAFGSSVAAGAFLDLAIVDNGEQGTTESGLLVLTDESFLSSAVWSTSGGAPEDAEAIAIEVAAP
jgi:subtilisin family serine protease